MALVTSREIVEQQGVSHRTLLRMIEAGDITPAQKLPGDTGAYVFEPDEVDRAFAERDRKRAEAERIAS
jgi:predicted site-specific integrase-resolvase